MIIISHLRSAGVNCSVRCGCCREKCRSRNLETNAAHDTIEEEGSQEKTNPEHNVNDVDKENQIVNIAPIMKNKRIMAPSHRVSKEEADMEMSFATRVALNRSKAKPGARKVRLSPDVLDDVTDVDCSVLAPRDDNAKSVFSPSVYQKFKTNQFQGGGVN